MGNEVYRQLINNQNLTTINISDLSNGVYFWEMSDTNGAVGKGKVVVIK
jgi:hypothetical protein